MADDPTQAPKSPANPTEEQSDHDLARSLSQLLQNETALRDLPAEQREKLSRLFKITGTRILAKYHSGYLPSPEDLIQYNQAVPNGADRIMTMAERQSAHRIEIESLVIRSQQIQSARGQVFGLVIGLFGISAGA